MRNKYPGTCYRCKKTVAVGEGHFERIPGGWKLQHAECALKYRGTDVGVDTEERARMKELQRKATISRWVERARGQGKKASKARANLRKDGLAHLIEQEAE